MFANLTNKLEQYPTDCLIKSDSTSDESLTNQTCTVCMESKSLIYFEGYYDDECKHLNRTICDSCMYDYIRANWNQHADIHCPECSIVLSHNAIKTILLNHNDMNLYERFVQFDFNRALEHNSEFIWCAHGCGSGQLNEGGSMNRTVKCVNCQKLTCFKHRIPWHEDLTCEEYDMPCRQGQQHASERWIHTNTKDCPKCLSHIEKNEGCDHMTCWKCKHEFCWECLAPYANIKRHGAYLHKRQCKHYPTTETRNIFKRFIDLF